MKVYGKVATIVAVLALAAAAQYFWVQKSDTSVPAESVVSPTASTTIPTTGIVDPSGKGYAVKQLPLPKEPSAPQAPNVQTVVAAIVPKDAYEKQVFATLSAALKSVQASVDAYNSWLTVGISLKELEKYDAARDVFAYVAAVWPMEAIPNGNLGSLYHLYLKDFPKSETAYKKAIELDPLQPAWYRGLYELYRYSYKTNTNLWEQTLQSGADKTHDTGLAALLAGRYAELKRFTESVAAYDVAIAEAEKQGNAKLVDTLIGSRAAARAEIK